MFIFSYADGSDYIGSTQELTIEVELCAQFTIVDDQIVESSELFSIFLQTSDPDVTLSNENANVTILDDADSKCCVNLINIIFVGFFGTV